MRRALLYVVVVIGLAVGITAAGVFLVPYIALGYFCTWLVLYTALS